MADTDRISILPDEVLFHILSFLPTEDVFATSLVSKRFRPLWLSVNNLDFDEYRFTPPGTRSLVRSHSPPSSFIKFISTAILACGIHQPIKKLRLCLSLPNPDLVQPPSSFIQFIHAAILRRGIHQPIKTLRLKGKSETFTTHVETWLTAAKVCNVENLEIICCSIHRLILPWSILSSTTLVVLKLHCTKFNDFSTVQLPSLKALHLNGVYVFNAQHLMELLNGSPNLETLEAHHVSFDYIDPSCKDKGKLKPLSKLVRADLSFMTMRILGIYNIDEFVRKFCNDVDIPIFPNLIQFQLILGGFVKMEAVLDLLNHCPQLQTLVLENTPGMDWPKTPVVVPECFSSQLQTCIIANFTGTECEIKFPKFVMQNSTSLHTMTIFSFPKLSHEKKSEIRIELDSCPRSSATCELLFK